MTSASSSNDLTNLRWQYIRSIETNQLLQDEIISLKSILKSKDAHELIQQNEIKKKNIKLKASLSEFKNKFIMMRSDLQNVKKNYIHDMSQMNSNFIQLKNYIKKIDSVNSLKNNQIYDEKTLLENKLLEIEKVSRSRIEKLTGESTKLQNELNLFKDKYEKLSHEHHQKLKDIQFLQDEKISFEEKLENSRSKITQLQKVIKKLQDENSNAANVTKIDFETKCHEYEQHITHLTNTNLSLEDEVARLQSEIERLKAGLNNAPKRSEFAKYVEVKMQNAHLQAQVQNLERKQMSNRKGKEREREEETIPPAPKIPLSRKKSTTTESTNNNHEETSSSNQGKRRPSAQGGEDSPLPINDEIFQEPSEYDLHVIHPKPYPPESPLISTNVPRRTNSADKKSIRQSQYRTNPQIRNESFSDGNKSPRGTLIVKSSDTGVDLGVPLMGKITRESLKARNNSGAIA